MVPVDINKLGNSCLLLIKEEAEMKGLKVSCSCDEDMPRLMIDKMLLKKILMILLLNSLKYTMSGFISIIISKKGDKVNIIVSDSGAGIDNNDVEKIFDPFSLSEKKQKSFDTGIGLNLYLCKQLARIMGGEIYATSMKNRVTSFIVTLPFINAGIDIPSSTQPNEKKVSHDRGSVSIGVTGHFNSDIPRKLSVLIVDDNVTNVFVLSTYIKRIGINYDVAYNGEKAVEAVINKLYDIIFMDINMPVMNGIDATKKIRRFNLMNGRPEQLIYAVTAQKETLTNLEISTANFDSICQKPLSLKYVQKIINDYQSSPSNRSLKKEA